MGVFQDTGVGGGAGSRTSRRVFQYQRLECCWDDGATSRWRCPPAANGKKAEAPCLFSVRRLKWSKVTSVLIPRKVAELSAKICHARARTEAVVCPAVVFMSPWGLPVLSRPLLVGHNTCRYHRGRDTFW
ncbi:uncharacterized protein [Zea mays]|jgi:hypothetical protein|uniref:Uncharacterized protein n=1 Tax=Zea mays TaxID=4577 RepID=A0A1D6I2R2_MAIZE|nr:uncharacterized protein LOC103632627 [Zea mays]ONM54457.1 hypothetical protein ZEAMMB73_Zm00001d020195 [Zea mays]|eukprot:XP_008652595.1 uncharacterized protein LOC103632627 [Zea mays]